MQTPIPSIFNIQSPEAFEQACMNVFRYQAAENSVYKNYIQHLGINVSDIVSSAQIPFLPISLFKSHSVICGKDAPQIVFTSSGTTGAITSRHLVKDTAIYTESFVKGFEWFYGPINDWVILALLPAYLERAGSSLIFMVEDLIKRTGQTESGFYLYETEALANQLRALEQKSQKTLLIGVSFALLDFVEQHQMKLQKTIVMETGGMKGRRKEMVREELHQQIGDGFGCDDIHSEYGMTELLSQAYSKGKGIFECPPWMQIRIRDTNDPFCFLPTGRSGGINVIDLANIHSCSFIATQDLGKCFPDGSFEILGRFDNSDIRGCNLLIA